MVDLNKLDYSLPIEVLMDQVFEGCEEPVQPAKPVETRKRVWTKPRKMRVVRLEEIEKMPKITEEDIDMYWDEIVKDPYAWIDEHIPQVAAYGSAEDMDFGEQANRELKAALEEQKRTGKWFIDVMLDQKLSGNTRERFIEDEENRRHRVIREISTRIYGFKTQEEMKAMRLTYKEEKEYIENQRKQIQDLIDYDEVASVWFKTFGEAALPITAICGGPRESKGIHDLLCGSVEELIPESWDYPEISKYDRLRYIPDAERRYMMMNIKIDLDADLPRSVVARRRSLTQQILDRLKEEDYEKFENDRIYEDDFEVIKEILVRKGYEEISKKDYNECSRHNKYSKYGFIGYDAKHVEEREYSAAELAWIRAIQDIPVSLRFNTEEQGEAWNRFSDYAHAHGMTIALDLIRKGLHIDPENDWTEEEKGLPKLTPDMNREIYWISLPGYFEGEPVYESDMERYHGFDKDFDMIKPDYYRYCCRKHNIDFRL